MYVIHVVPTLICHVSSIDEVDEFWCDRANRTTPLDLVQGTTTAFPVPTCGGCTTSCSGGSTEDNPYADECCGWDNPAVDDDPDSLRDPRRFPLGFTTAVMPRLESDDPRPCVTVTIDDTSRQTYIQVALESDSLIW